MDKPFFTKGIMALLLCVSLFPFTAMADIPDDYVVYPRGDLNYDQRISISDVALLIDHLLRDECLVQEDVNADGQVSISDVTALIDYLLTGEWTWAYTAPEIPADAEVFTVNGVTFAMNYVEGADNVSPYSGFRTDTTAGLQYVKIRDFYMGQTEVTHELWSAVMGTPIQGTWYVPYEPSPWHPIESVSAEDIEEFISRLNELTGREFHLPTIAQWRWAKTGGVRSQHYSFPGSNDIGEVAWIDPTMPYPHKWNCVTMPVGLKKPNELGLYDMYGNVWEIMYNYDALDGDELVGPTSIIDTKIGVLGGSTGSPQPSPSGTFRWEWQEISRGHGKAGMGGIRLAMQKD